VLAGHNRERPGVLAVGIASMQLYIEMARCGGTREAADDPVNHDDHLNG